jgi:hypothetical protein
MNRLIIILFVLFFSSELINGQVTSVNIDRNFNSLPLSELIRYLETKQDLKFFYLNKWIDSVVVIQTETPSSLGKVLSESLINTKLSYFTDNNRNIIITYQYHIESELPELFKSEERKNLSEQRSLDVSSFLKKEHMESLPEIKQNEPELIIVGTPGKVPATGKATISGVISEKETGQPIIGAVIYIDAAGIGTSTDKYGYYVLSVPNGIHELHLKYLGRKDQILRISVNGSGNLNLNMEEKLLELRGVVISADKEMSVKSLQIGLEKIDIQTIRQVSSTLGEGDLIKSALLLPGVKSVGEGASGFNVRGGGTDQNLILMDGSPVFNPSHIFGFFSVFNPDVVGEFKLYKSGIPSQYGGRLSSVLDISIKNGNLKKISVTGGISPIAGRLTIDGPVIKDKASFLISCRSSYSDWLLKRTNVPSLVNSSAGFLDLNAKLDYKINGKNHLTASGYYSEDQFRLNSDTLYYYSNLTANINLKHNFSKKMYGLVSAIYSSYSYSVRSLARIPYSFDLRYQINYIEGRTDFTWFLNSDHKLNFGANIIKYKINPGSLNPGGTGSVILPKKIPDEQAIETGIYMNDEFNVTSNLSVNFGLRYSGFFSLGPAEVYKYLPDAPRSIENRIDSVYYGKSKITNLEGGPEFRLTARYLTGPSGSIKLSYTDMYQYLQMISNTTAISPTDIWKVAGPNLPAQKSRQISLGFYKYLMSNKLLSSVEVYYKTTENILEYRGGSQILMNQDLEVDLLSGRGKAYGVEIMFKKEYGTLNGWISYTYSRSLIKVDSKYLIDQINQGKYYPSDYDKPHDITLVANYRFSRIHSISNTITYSTGRPITYPVAKYQFRERELIHYSNRNEYRIPDYFRWDISINFEGKLNKKTLRQSSMSISVYNLTGRANAYSIYFVSDEAKKVNGYKLSVFSRPIVSVSYDFRF